jgi:predicted amidohydrolase YtcJ
LSIVLASPLPTLSILTETFNMTSDIAPDLILHNGRFTTLDRSNPAPQAVAVTNGRFTAIGDVAQIMAIRTDATRLIDCGGRRVIPGLHDNHCHIIRAGLSYNMELRWDGVRSLADAMAMLREQVAITPPPQWVRVVGGFTAHQFAEKRLPTLSEINEAAPDTPVFLLHLYDRALLNAAALRAVGYDRDTPEPPGGEIQRDASGNPTGLLLAKPNAAILYATLAKGPRLPEDYQLNSTRHYMRELNRLGITGALDAGGGFQKWPDDYGVIRKLAADGELTVRIGYNLFTQKPNEERQDFLNWCATVKHREGDDYFRHNGAGEMLVYTAADFEDFRQPRPEMPEGMEGDLEDVVRILVENRWPWRLHATYDETLSRALDVFERVNAEMPLDGINWFFDHAETISDRSIDRVAALGGGIAVQHRMAYQGEYFIERYGATAAEATPPVKRMLDAGVNVSAGTDATRVASYNPWVSLAWLVTGRTLGGTVLYPVRNRLDRETALRMWTEKVAWFANQPESTGQIVVGNLADLSILDRDYMNCPEEDITGITARLTMVGGKVVWATGEYASLDPGAPPAMPDWSPVNRYGGYGAWATSAEGRATTLLHRAAAASCGCATACLVHGHDHARSWTARLPTADVKSFWGALGCACWA